LLPGSLPIGNPARNNCQGGAFLAQTLPLLATVPETAAAEATGAAESAPEEVVDLYHGTNSSGAENILKNGVDPSYAPRNRDFGNGFYTSEERSLAENWAAKVDVGEDPAVFRPSTNYDMELQTISDLGYSSYSRILLDEPERYLMATGH
jgi:hypothetical protein